MNVISSSLQILQLCFIKNKNRVCKEALSFPYDFMQYLHILVQNCNTRCSQRCKCSSTRGIPINLVLLDGQISLLYIYELVWGLGVIGLKWDYFEETPLFDPIFLNIVSYSCLWLTPSVIFFADLERLDNFLSENVYFSYTSMYTLKITVV